MYNYLICSRWQCAMCHDLMFQGMKTCKLVATLNGLTYVLTCRDTLCFFHRCLYILKLVSYSRSVDLFVYKFCFPFPNRNRCEFSMNMFCIEQVACLIHCFCILFLCYKIKLRIYFNLDVIPLSTQTILKTNTTLFMVESGKTWY